MVFIDGFHDNLGPLQALHPTGMVDRICQGADAAALDRKQQAVEVPQRGGAAGKWWMGL